MRDNFSIIVAVSKNFGIGYEGKLPWKLKEDINYFKKITTDNIVIMGRKTYESIHDKFRPLPNRINIILSSNPNLRNELNLPDCVEIAHSLDSAILLAQSYKNKIFIIGGEKVYNEAINSPLCNRIYLTNIENDFVVDTFFPEISLDKYKLTSVSDPITENNIKYSFLVFDKII